ncbi:hypothetical protein C8F04DRAFT_1238054 [Mycena alexandri]|uniref:Uncharacterized protein n=1 Tax=Mycena alexandri TaxID=1745969 RepID=A0AAD6WW59_9AGAR|nr:hypothetical protein C8F04DRAFT_1238054 [Mycena alexandri]
MSSSQQLCSILGWALSLTVKVKPARVTLGDKEYYSRLIGTISLSGKPDVKSSLTLLPFGGEVVTKAGWARSRVTTPPPSSVDMHSHASSVFRWQLKGLAFIDLLLTLLEIAGVSDLIHTVFIAQQFDVGPQSLYSAACAIELVGVTIVAGVRIGTITTSPEPFFRQRLTFLGGFTPVHPPYTPARIQSRPKYSPHPNRVIPIILISLKYVSPFQLNNFGYGHSPPGNASIFLTPLETFHDIGNATYNIQVRIWTEHRSNLNCETKSSISIRRLTMPGTGSEILLQCTITYGRRDGRG